MNVAAKVTQDKERHPEQFCPKQRCLWRTGGGYCPRHVTLDSVTGKPVQDNPEALALQRKAAEAYSATLETH